MSIKDNSLIAQYIRAIENPDSLGYRNGIWTDKGVYDPNNRGFGVDVEKNKAAAELTKNRKRKWLTEKEEREIRLGHTEDNLRALDENTPKILRVNPSEEKKAMALGVLYRGNSVLTNPSLRDAYLFGSDKDMQKAVSDYYNNTGVKYLIQRAKDHNKFFDNKGKKKEDTLRYIRRPKEEPYKPKKFSDYEYKPKKLFAEGGALDNHWNSLSMKDKAEMMRVAIKNGITTLPEIREAYNKFAEGGPKKSYEDFATRLSRVWNGEDLSKHDYDYEKYFNDNPNRAYEQLESLEHGGEGHFPDGGESGIYKLPTHPTYPDLGEDSWSDNDTIFHISDRQNEGDTDKILDYLGSDLGYNRGATKVMHDDYYVLPSVQVVSKKDNPNFTEAYPGLVPNKYHTGWVYEDSPSRDKNFAYGGNLFGDGGKKNKKATNAEKAMSYLVGKGMSITGAAAIVGTLQAESNLDPTIHARMPGDTGEGLAQWTGSRKNLFWTTLESMEPGARKKYGSIDKVPFERQLDVVLAERPDVVRAIHSAKDLKTATDIMLRGYENGGGNINNLATVGQMNSIYGKWNNGYDNQMKTRLGNANKLLGLSIDPSSYQISKGFFDDINSQINGTTLPETPLPDEMATDPTLRYKPVTIDQTMIEPVQPKAPIAVYDNPNQERLQGLKNYASMMGLMGETTPFTGLIGSGTQGLMNAIYNI
jgi:hypothetical protein